MEDFCGKPKNTADNQIDVYGRQRKGGRLRQKTKKTFTADKKGTFTADTKRDVYGRQKKDVYGRQEKDVYGRQEKRRLRQTKKGTFTADKKRDDYGRHEKGRLQQARERTRKDAYGRQKTFTADTRLR